MTPEGNLAPPPNWWSRNWKWALPVGCLGMLATCGCLFTVFFGVLFSSVKNNEAYEQGISIATTDDEVQAVLGAPLTPGTPRKFSVSTVNGRGRAEFIIPLDGSKADGMLHIEAYEEDGRWSYSTLEVEVPDREPIDLRDRVGGSARELAPPTPDDPPPAPPALEGDSDINL